MASECVVECASAWPLFAGLDVADVLVVQRILVQSPGGMNGVAGRFEWIVDGNSLTHQRFVPEGSINGIPNTP